MHQPSKNLIEGAVYLTGKSITLPLFDSWRTPCSILAASTLHLLLLRPAEASSYYRLERTPIAFFKFSISSAFRPSNVHQCSSYVAFLISFWLPWIRVHNRRRPGDMSTSVFICFFLRQKYVNVVRLERNAKTTLIFPRWGGGGEGYSLQCPLLGGSARKGIFFRLQVYARVGILLVEVYKRVGKSVI